MTHVLSPNLSWEFIHNFVVFKKNWCEVIYYEKNSDGKTYPFANVNTSCHFKMGFFWHFEFKKFGIWESTQFCLKTICLWLSSLLNSRLKIWVIETFNLIEISHMRPVFSQAVDDNLLGNFIIPVSATC